MKKKLLIIVLITLVMLVVMTLGINRLAECYPRFTIELKTPGDGCDLSYLLLRIGYLPHALVVFIATFITLRVIRHQKQEDHP
jgi:hypothetical protein